MKTYKVPVTFTFKGVFEIKADNIPDAREQIEKHVGLVLGGDIHHTLDDEDIEWEFGVHPDKKIGVIKLEK